MTSGNEFGKFLEIGKRVNGFPLTGGRVRCNFGKDAQSSSGCPWIPGSVGWGFEQPGIVKGIPAHLGGLKLDDLYVSSKPNRSMTQCLIYLADLKNKSVITLQYFHLPDKSLCFSRPVCE